MLEGVKDTILKAQQAVEAIADLEKVLREAAGYENIAVVKRDGKYHVILLTEEQARPINGLSVPIGSSDELVNSAKKLILDELQRQVSGHHAALKPFANEAKPFAGQGQSKSV